MLAPPSLEMVAYDSQEKQTLYSKHARSFTIRVHVDGQLCQVLLLVWETFAIALTHTHNFKLIWSLSPMHLITSRFHCGFSSPQIIWWTSFAHSTFWLVVYCYPWSRHPNPNPKPYHLGYVLALFMQQGQDGCVTIEIVTLVWLSHWTIGVTNNTISLKDNWCDRYARFLTVSSGLESFLESVFSWDSSIYTLVIKLLKLKNACRQDLLPWCVCTAIARAGSIVLTRPYIIAFHIQVSTPLLVSRIAKCCFE